MQDFGDWFFLADPCLSSHEQPVFWRTDVDSSIVSIIAAENINFLMPGQPVMLQHHHINHARRKGDDWYIILIAGKRHIRAVYHGRTIYLDRPLIIPLAIADDLADRLTGIEHFMRAIYGKVKQADDRLTALQKQRLIRMLQTVDAHRNRATTRDIARAVFGERFVVDEDWKTSSTRIKTLNLLRDGKAMVQGGYLRLLRWHRKKSD